MLRWMAPLQSFQASSREQVQALSFWSAGFPALLSWPVVQQQSGLSRACNDAARLAASGGWYLAKHDMKLFVCHKSGTMCVSDHNCKARCSSCNRSALLTNRTPPKAADLAADLGPVRSCKKPPVKAPAAMEFQGSSCTVHTTCCCC